MIIATKPSQQLGALPSDSRIWDLLPGTGNPPEKFLPTPLIIQKLLTVRSPQYG